MVARRVAYLDIGKQHDKKIFLFKEGSFKTVKCLHRSLIIIVRYHNWAVLVVNWSNWDERISYKRPQLTVLVDIITIIK